MNPEGEISQRKINANTFIKRDKVSVPSPSRLNELVSCANQWHIRLILLLARALIGVFGRIITFEALGVFFFVVVFFSFLFLNNMLLQLVVVNAQLGSPPHESKRQITTVVIVKEMPVYFL